MKIKPQVGARKDATKKALDKWAPVSEVTGTRQFLRTAKLRDAPETIKFLISAGMQA
jgi:hypothetical protein